MIYPPSIWRQLHEAKTSIEGVAVHKHHEFSTGAVNAEVLSSIVGICVPKDALKDGVPLWRNVVVSGMPFLCELFIYRSVQHNQIADPNVATPSVARFGICILIPRSSQQ